MVVPPSALWQLRYWLNLLLIMFSLRHDRFAQTVVFCHKSNFPVSTAHFCPSEMWILLYSFSCSGKEYLVVKSMGILHSNSSSCCLNKPEQNWTLFQLFEPFLTCFDHQTKSKLLFTIIEHGKKSCSLTKQGIF